jgi:alkylation response protein AidB-like acyl-CoA dehydrogenase
MLDTSRRTAFTAEHDMFRDQVRRFFAAELEPHLERWEAEGIVDRDLWTKCGAQGLLCPTVPETYGGLGLDFGYNAVIDEELAISALRPASPCTATSLPITSSAMAARSRSSTGCRA